MTNITWVYMVAPVDKQNIWSRFEAHRLWALFKQSKQSKVYAASAFRVFPSPFYWLNGA